MDDRLRAARELWATYREQGVAAAIPLLHPEVEFIDHTGRRFLGHDGVGHFFAEFEERGERCVASPYTFELHEPDLLVVGHRRISSEEGVRGDYLYFVHGFRDGQVCRLTAHLSRDVALAEIEARSHGRS